MEGISISISKNAVYTHTATLVALYARQKENYEAMALTPDNYPLLDALLVPAVSEMKKALAISYTNSSSIVDGNILLTLNDDSGLINNDTKALLIEQIKFALSYMLASLWLSSVEKEAGEMYAASATSYINDAAALFARRYRHLSDDEYRASQTDTSVDGGNSIMDDALTRSGDSHIDGDCNIMADALTRAADSHIDGDCNIMADSTIPKKDNVIEKPWALRHCLRDCHGKLLTTKH